MKPYKSYELYCSFALNRLVSELDVDIYQVGLEEKLEGILAGQSGVSKGEIKYEIKSNNHMTNKVIEKLEKEKLISVEKLPDKYIIRITKAGVIHVKKFNEFYWQMFRDHIKEHYKYREVPLWFERLK